MKEVIFSKQNVKRVFSLALVMVMILAMLPGMAVTADAAGVDDYLFDWEYYYNKYPDLQKAFGKNQAKLRNHYNTYGKKEGRCPSDVFDPVFYLNKYSDLKAAFGNDYKAAYNHFVNNGIREGRQASASFSVEVYKSNYADLRNAFGTAASDNWEYIRHWAQYGRKEGRNATSTIASNGNSDNNRVQPNTSGWQWPMSGYWVTQAFNNKRNSSSRPYHCGIDIKASNTNVYAAATGTVVYKGYSSGNGYHVVISHNLNGTTVKSLYSHLANYNSCPAVGQTVSKGTKIGVMGSTGNSTGPHLHFAIYTGSSNDPWGYASSSGSNKISYNGCVFFNPSYVISNGRLP